MREHGYTVGNIDCTIIAQRPKLSPHKEAIREGLCGLLGAHPSVVNIKVGAGQDWGVVLCGAVWRGVLGSASSGPASPAALSCSPLLPG